MPAVPDDISLAEVYRLVQSLRADINGLGQRIEKQGETFMPRETFETVVEHIRQEQRDFSESLRWAQRTAVTALLLPVVVALIVFLVMNSIEASP